MIKIVDNIEEESESKKIDLGNGLFVTWNRSSSEMIHFNKNEEDEKVLDLHSDNILLVKKINKKYFISVSKDNTIKIWKNNGDLYSSFTNHDTTILGIQIEKDTVLSISKNDSIRVWSFNGKEIFNIESEVKSLEQVSIWQDSIHLLIDKVLTIYSISNGKEIIKFENQLSFIDNFKQLNSDNILIQSNSTITLSNKDGVKIKDIRLKFDFNNIMELEDNNLAILTSDNTIYILDVNGETISSYLKDDEFNKDFDKFKQSSVEVLKTKKEKTTIEQFPHVYNPFGQVMTNSEDEINKQELNFEKTNKDMWDFFNRPLFTPITKLLKKEENLSKRYIKSIKALKSIKDDLVKEKDELIAQAKKSKTTFIIILLVSLVLGVGYGYMIDQIGYGALLISAIFTFLVISKNGEITEAQQIINTTNQELKTIDIVSNETKNLISNIKTYRNTLLKQFPIVKDKTLFNGDKINNIINNCLTNKIHKIAMQECGLELSDIIHESKQAIILNEGSLIQSDKNRVDEHNIKSFWGIKDDIIFATQFIQYIFLTEDKIDVFNTHYDFIQEKYIRKEAHAFYYKDVTNITKKEVERKLMGSDKASPATEIILKVSSGDKIEVTILNSETLSIFNSEIDTDSNDDEKIEELEKNRLKIENDDSYDDEEEKEEELELIDAQITALKSKECISESSLSVKSNKGDETIQNIRKQVKMHKQ